MIFKDEKKVNRFAIYLFYDKDGIVDDYVIYYLKELGKFVKYLLVVVHGALTDESRKKIETVCDEILIRENKGCDVTAYRVGLSHLTEEKIETYDEYILGNSSLVGPIYPFEEMFETMNKKDLDFWGITKHHKVDFDCFNTCKYGYIPEHIQSSFMVIRRSLFITDEYKNMWRNLPQIDTYEQAIGWFEAIFTKEFSEMGFKHDVYINTDDLDGYTRYPLMMMSFELIKNRKCPVMKLKSFSQNYYDFITDTVCNSTVDTYEFIDKHTDYDVNMIWDNILRNCNMADIKNLMHLNYILPKDHKLVDNYTNNKKIALLIHIYYDELIDYCINYAKNMPKYADLLISVSKESLLEKIEQEVKNLPFNNTKVILIENRGRDVSSLLVGFAPYINKYDYICFVHDKKTTQIKPYCNGQSFSYKCFENLLGSEDFIENILKTFDDNPRLGMLMPPPPNHGHFYQIVGSEWASNYENTLALAHKLKLNCHISWEKEPISPLGTMFWFRSKSLRTLFDYNWKYDDFPPEPNGFDGSILHAIERVYGFVVQHEGYYPAWVMNDKFASIELTNIHFMLREINSPLLSKYYTTNLLDMTEKLKSNFKVSWDSSMGLRQYAVTKLPTCVVNIIRRMKWFIKRKLSNVKF